MNEFLDIRNVLWLFTSSGFDLGWNGIWGAPTGANSLLRLVYSFFNRFSSFFAFVSALQLVPARLPCTVLSVWYTIQYLCGLLRIDHLQDLTVQILIPQKYGCQSDEYSVGYIAVLDSNATVQHLISLPVRILKFCIKSMMPSNFFLGMCGYESKRILIQTPAFRHRSAVRWIDWLTFSWFNVCET